MLLECKKASDGNRVKRQKKIMSRRVMSDCVLRIKYRETKEKMGRPVRKLLA
jgi:hypothetical protein